MRPFLTTLAVLAILVPATAMAALSLDIAFDPEEACPGDEVYFFFSLENVGGQEEMVEFSVTFEIDGEVFGPFTGEFPLAAGEEISREGMLFIPPFVPPVSLVVTVEATDSDGTVTDSASLTILDCGGGRGPQIAKVNKGAKALAKSFKKTLKEMELR
jgi:hypothetical protein